VLRQRMFWSGGEVHIDGSKDLDWFDDRGAPMTQDRWADERLRTLQMLLNGAWENQASLLVVLHGGEHEAHVTLPHPPGATAYELLWDSAWDRPPDAPIAVPSDQPVRMLPASMRIYRVVDPT